MDQQRHWQRKVQAPLVGWHLVFHELSRVFNPLYTLGKIYALHQGFGFFFNFSHFIDYSLNLITYNSSEPEYLRTQKALGIGP